MSTTFPIEQGNIEAAKQYLEEHFGIPADAVAIFQLESAAGTYTLQVELAPQPLTPRQAADILKLLGGESL